MNTQIALALTTVQVLFGLNYVVSKIIVDTINPLVWAATRIQISALALIGIAFLSKRKPPKFTKSFLRSLALFSFLGIAGNQAAFLTGLHYTTATNSAILVTLIPLTTLLFLSLLGKETLTLKRTIGFLLALVGVMVIRKVENFSMSDRTLIGDSLTILNCILYGLFLSLSKPFLEKHDPIWITALLFVFGSFFLTLFAMPSWMQFQWPALSDKLLACMLFNIFGGTLLAYFLNLWALRRTKSSSVALYIYLQPVIASLTAWGWLGEQPTLRTILASTFIFLGIAFAMQRTGKQGA